MSSLRYVSLSDLFPTKDRSTLWRWRRAGKIPPPDLVIGNREFWIERPFAPPADKRKAASTDKAAPQPVE